MTQHTLMTQLALATYDDEANTVRLVFYQKESADPMAPITHQVVVVLPDAEQFTMEEAPSDPVAQQNIDQAVEINPLFVIEPHPADETLEG